MIFSKQQMETAMSYMSYKYNKVLMVNLASDIFKPIKVETREWDELNKELSFSEWCIQFANSGMCHSDFKEPFLFFTNLKRLSERDRPDYIYYKKKIDDEWHNVVLEFIPIGADIAYIYVKDLTKGGYRTNGWKKQLE